MEKEGRINFLDVTIIRTQDGSLIFEVYRKPTHTGQYINANSNAPRSHMLSTVRSMTKRVTDIPTTQAAKEAEHARVRKELAINGYTMEMYNRGKHRPNAPRPDRATTQQMRSYNAGTVADQNSATGTAGPSNNGHINTDTNTSTAAAARKGHVSMPFCKGIT